LYFGLFNAEDRGMFPFWIVIAVQSMMRALGMLVMGQTELSL